MEEKYFNGYMDMDSREKLLNKMREAGTEEKKVMTMGFETLFLNEENEKDSKGKKRKGKKK